MPSPRCSVEHLGRVTDEGRERQDGEHRGQEDGDVTLRSDEVQPDRQRDEDEQDEQGTWYAEGHLRFIPPRGSAPLLRLPRIALIGSTVVRVPGAGIVANPSSTVPWAAGTDRRRRRSRPTCTSRRRPFLKRPFVCGVHWSGPPSVASHTQLFPCFL